MLLNKCIFVTLFSLLLTFKTFALETGDPDMFNYKDHPCKRSCKEGEKPKTCRYIFVVERYATMSKACHDCPNNVTDCFRPHCIVADGVTKSVFSVNRQVPGPPIEVCENDMIEVEVTNKMLSEITTIHWHGFKQAHTGYMDGVPYVSQCPILPGQNFIYKFQATTTGTFFYHSHIGNQKADGLFGALIVHRITELEPIKKLNIHGEHIAIVNDWSHQRADDNLVMDLHVQFDFRLDTILINGLGHNESFLSEFNPTKNTPIAEFVVTKNKNYRFRVIGAASEDCPIRMTIDQHEIKVISLDSNDIEYVTVDALTIWPGERIDFVLEATQKSDSYWIRFVGDVLCKPRAHQRALLRYDDAALSKPEDSTQSIATEAVNTLRILNPYNDGVEAASDYNIIISNLKSLEPNDKSLLQREPDYKIYMSLDYYRINNNHYHRKDHYGYNQVSLRRRMPTPQFDHISMQLPSVPLMSQWQSANESSFCNATHQPRNLDCAKEHCQCTHVLRFRLNSVVELILVDEGTPPFDGIDEINHPMHIHGHYFRVIASENLNGSVSIDRVKKLDESGKIKRTLDHAPLKDTMKTPAGGYTIIRFHANNPGYWFFHCHYEAHVNQGMALIFKVGEHEDFPILPKDFPKCGNTN